MKKVLVRQISLTFALLSQLFMNLAVDIGNSLSKLAVFSEHKQIVRLLITHSPQSHHFKLITESFKIDNCIISSVRDDNTRFEKFLSPDTGLLHMNSSTPLPFQNFYKTPSTLGNDRKALVAGATSIYPNSTILIISCGTAITYDYIDNSGRYHGGAISPGMQMRFKSLNTFTGKLPLVNGGDFSGFTGATTAQSIAAGVVEGITGEIQHFISLYRNKASGLKIILTGGDAKYFDKMLKNKIFALPNLALTGLNEIMEFNA